MARPKKLDALSLSELQSLISERKSRVSELRREQKKLLKKLDVIEKEIERAGGEAGSGRSRGGTRPRNAMSLADTIDSVLKSGKPMGVPDIADAVLATGYKSSSPKFTAIVNQTLIKDKRFSAVERGVYVKK